jgi:hypothetical protein
MTTDHGAAPPGNGPAAASDWPAQVGRYASDGEIARGGRGVVLRGRDPDFNRTLAVKVLLARHQDAPALVRRFLEEAHLCGQLQHPGVPPVHERGTLPDGRTTPGRWPGRLAAGLLRATVQAQPILGT